MSQHSNNHAGVTMAAMIHLAASIPELTLASDTHYPWLVDGTDIIEGPKLTIQGGKMAIPAGPGLGVTLDHDKLARAHETYVKCGMRGRDDRSLMRRLEPGWTGELLVADRNPSRHQSSPIAASSRRIIGRSQSLSIPSAVPETSVRPSGRNASAVTLAS